MAKIIIQRHQVEYHAIRQGSKVLGREGEAEMISWIISM
jgi:hypothetical protein